MAGTNGWTPPDYVESTWREIDTCCKILEMIPHSPHGKYDEGTIFLLLKIKTSFHKLLQHSRHIWDEIQLILGTTVEF